MEQLEQLCSPVYHPYFPASTPVPTSSRFMSAIKTWKKEMKTTPPTPQAFKSWMNHYLSEAASPAPTPGKLEKKLESEAQKLVAMQERIYHLEQMEETKRNPTNPPTPAPPTAQPTSLWHTHEHPECPATPSDISRCALERGCCAEGKCIVGDDMARKCDRNCSLSDMLTYCLSGKPYCML